MEKEQKCKCGHYDKYPVPIFKEIKNPKTGKFEGSDKINFYICNECYVNGIYHRQTGR